LFALIAPIYPTSCQPVVNDEHLGPITGFTAN